MERQQRIVIVGGGVAGLAIATSLGRRWRRRQGAPAITLIDSDSAHVWKPMLHNIAVASTSGLSVADHAWGLTRTWRHVVKTYGQSKILAY